MIRVPAPALEHFSGEQLAGELRSAGYRQVTVNQHGTEVAVGGVTAAGFDIDERSRSRVEQVVRAHFYVPLQQRVADLQTELSAARTRIAYLEQHAVLKPTTGGGR